MSDEILDATRDAARWRGLLAELPPELRDVYFAPEYAALSAGLSPGASALLFCHREPGALWLHVVLKRPVLEVAGEAADGGWSDLESAYGYAGPLSAGASPEFLARAHAAFDAWCTESRVVAEFVRLHPLIGNERWLDPRAEVVVDRSTVSADLAAFDGEVIPFDKAARNAATRAERDGVSVREASGDADFETFRGFYEAAMETMGADEFYRFPAEYFAGLRELISASGFLLIAERGGAPVAAAAFLAGSAFLHYHLAASAPGPRVAGAGNLLILEAARRGRRAGLRSLHMGGGRTTAPDDPLFKFKRAMGTETRTFRVAKQVRDARGYGLLRARWLERAPELAARYGGRLLCYRYAPASAR